MKSRLLSGYDLILLIYPETKGLNTVITFSGRTQQLESLFIKAGLFK